MAEISYINSDENSQYREIPKNEQEQRMYMACVRCHTWGKLASHRNTKSQWEEIRNLHIGYYPTVILQMRQMDWAVESKDLVKTLSERFPFDAPQWREWLLKREAINPEGKWLLSGYQPGNGYYHGFYLFIADPAKGENEFIVEKEIVYENGTSLKIGGEATLFAGYHIRYALAPTPLTGRIEGVFDFDGIDKSFKGKWWTLIQDSNAFGNEQFIREDGPPMILSVFPQAIRASDNEQKITIIGANLPQNLIPEDIRFSEPNINASSIERVKPSEVVCRLKLGKDVKTGVSEMSIKDLTYKNTLKVYHQIDSIKIHPELGRARVSCGAAYPPQGVQFVARGISYGEDGKSGTADDLVLEPIDAKWWLEEQKTNEYDDDIKYLQTSIKNGLYTPITTYGPIEQRLMRKEGTGLIAVCASFIENGKELKDRARLAVTVPDFITHIK
jgi:quinohemoprotein amine dehydrogenase